MKDYRSDPIGYILYKAKRRAKRKGVEFDLERSDIVLPAVCPFFRTEFEFDPQEARDFYYGPSLDRIDSSLGYVKGNVRVISYLANVMKWASNHDELVEFAEGILRIERGNRPWYRES